MVKRVLTSTTGNSPHAGQRGFTLIEVLLAISMFVVIVVALFSSYTGSLRIMKITEPQADLYRKARVTMNRIADDLESAYSSAKQEEDEQDDAPARFLGVSEMIDTRDADTLQFISRAHVAFGDQRAEAVGKTVISYYLEEAEDGLVLLRADTPYYAEQPEERTGGLILCDGLRGVNFLYFDDKGDEHDEWDIADEMREGKFPSMVRVQIWMSGESEEAPLLTFATAVTIPVSTQ